MYIESRQTALVQIIVSTQIRKCLQPAHKKLRVSVETNCKMNCMNEIKPVGEGVALNLGSFLLQSQMRSTGRILLSFISRQGLLREEDGIQGLPVNTAPCCIGSMPHVSVWLCRSPLQTVLSGRCHFSFYQKPLLSVHTFIPSRHLQLSCGPTREYWKNTII